MQYLSRAADRQLQDTLGAMGGVLIEGPRACGKTSTALQLAGSSVRLDQSPELITLADLDPSAVFAGDTPRLIDEWQLAPSLWNSIRHEIDSRQQVGQFILSGSASPHYDVTRHSGAGRIGRLRMHTMSLAESGASSAEIPLNSINSSTTVSAHSPLTYRDLAEQAVRGGWPGYLGLTTHQAMIANRSYLDNLCNIDIPQATGIRHTPRQVRRLLTSLARNISQEVTLKTLAHDTDTDEKTVSTYLDALSTVFAYDPLPAWSVSLRSKSRLRTSPKVHLCDPSIGLAALGISAERLAAQPDYFGQVYESMVIRDLRALASADGGTVYHYRDNTGLEVDAIIEYWDGSWAGIEVKLGSTEIPKGEANLLKLRDERINLDTVGPPRYLAVITGTEYALTLPSGVHVIPLGTIGI